jgi:hypothetical protein
MIAFKIVPFSVDTQLHTMLPMSKAIPQVMFCKAVEGLRRFCFHIFLLTYLLHGAESFLRS